MVIIPLADVALRASDLIRSAQYWAVLWQTLVAIAITLSLAGTFRLAHWIMKNEG